MAGINWGRFSLSLNVGTITRARWIGGRSVERIGAVRAERIRRGSSQTVSRRIDAELSVSGESIAENGTPRQAVLEPSAARCVTQRGAQISRPTPDAQESPCLIHVAIPPDSRL